MKRIRRSQPDILAITALFLLWLLFFWRLFTPVDADQVSIVEGDFSNQFVAFGAYQYSRFEQGSIPLWNPYNNGGLPFIADTQAAVFYPPRLITIALSSLAGGWGYNALQMEMTAHVLLYTLFMYVLMRRMTLGNGHAGCVGAFVAAVIVGYGGFAAGYPTQQLALLEAGIWLPAALLGIYEATKRQGLNWSWLLLAGFFIGISWMAGHPQTSWFSTYLIVAYLGYRVLKHGLGWRRYIAATATVGLITVGITAVQLLPSIEYLAYTTRTGIGFDAKSGGFPVQDVVQFVYPSVVSVWSPLYIGVASLILAAMAFLGNARERWFWGTVTLIALGLSLGGNSSVYHAFYNLVPGLRYFRGQERAAFLVVNSLAILAGLGLVALSPIASEAQFAKRVKQSLVYFTLGTCLVATAIFVAWVGDPPSYANVIGPIVFSTIVAIFALILVPRVNADRFHPMFPILLAGLVSFELFSVNIDNSNFQTIPSDEQPIMSIPPLASRVHEDTSGVFRVDGGMVDGHIGIYGRGNSGSMYGLQDIRGISPLFLDGPHAIIQRDLPHEIAWELFSVKYIFTDWEVLPVESELIARDYPNSKTLNLHRLNDPRPFVLLVHHYEILDDNHVVLKRLTDSGFDARSTVLLAEDPQINVSSEIDNAALAHVTAFAPEHFIVETSSQENSILSVSLADYPGWKVEIDGTDAKTIRAYGALTALPLPAGDHTISFTYDPPSYRLGAYLSLVTWVGLGILAVVSRLRSIVNHANK